MSDVYFRAARLGKSFRFAARETVLFLRSKITQTRHPKVFGTLLHTCICEGHFDILEAVVTQESSPEELNFTGESLPSNRETPLLAAIRIGDAKAFNLLLRVGADPLASTRGGLTCIAYASMFNMDDKYFVEKLLSTAQSLDPGMLQRQLNFEEEFTSPLRNAILHGNYEIAESLMQYGATLDIPNSPHLSILGQVLVEGREHCMKQTMFCLDPRKSFRPANPLCCGKGMRSALHLVGLFGGKTCIDILAYGTF